MAKRVKKYLLFMFGNWKSVEENQQVVSNIREVMETIITAFFLMVKPRKLGFRLDENLEKHLFGLEGKKSNKYINPQVAEEIAKQLKSVMVHRMKNIKRMLESPLQPESNLRKPFSLDSLLDKIIDEGIESLTQYELEYLNKYN